MASKLSANNRNSIGRFVQGSSGNPNGRPVGSKNKFTTLKSAFIDAFEEIGGVDIRQVSFDCLRQSDQYSSVTKTQKSLQVSWLCL